MTSEQLWQRFAHQGRFDPASRNYRARAFSDDLQENHELVELVLMGAKTATAPCLWELGYLLPSVGGYTVVLADQFEARCVVMTTQVDVVPFSKVSEEFIKLEGEGDGSVVAWRKAHWAYYQRILRPKQLEPTENMPIVCHQFELVYD